MTVEPVLQTTNAPAMCAVGPIVAEQRVDLLDALIVLIMVNVRLVMQIISYSHLNVSLKN